MNLEEIQGFCKKILTKVSYPRLGAMIGLQEELGEIAKILMDVEIYERPLEKKLFEKKFGETFFSLIDLCNSYDIDLEKISKTRIKEIKEKINDWEEKHQETLEYKRNKIN